MSNFDVVREEWPEVYEDALKAEAALRSDPRTACFYARRTLEQIVRWVYKADASLKLPYDDKLSALIHEPTFKATAGIIFNKARVINRIGNRAVHESKLITDTDSLVAVRELFHVCYWLAFMYGKDKPDPNLTFNEDFIPQPMSTSQRTTEQLQALERSLHEKDEDLAEALSWVDDLDEELKRLRAEVAEAKKAAAKVPDSHDYSEAETRDYFIDLLLQESGWKLDDERDREYRVEGMPNDKNEGFVDYVLWGDDGKPVGLVEAKRTKRDARAGQQQAKLYADCLEKEFGQRPVIFYSNGYEHWLWDDTNDPPRSVQGFYRKEELQLLIQRRTTRKSLAEVEIDDGIVERYYQTRAIRRVGDAFDKDNERKALLVMATGAGKTRTVIALADVLMRANWAKRVLFLADRTALVNQTVNAFKAHLPNVTTANLVKEKDVEGRVYVSTYQTMMGLIDDMTEGERRFGVGHFDLVVIDEAHRSVFQKYRAIFDYFDARLVGLTATPRDEVARSTYDLFDLEPGTPTDAYSLEEAVADGFLVPPVGISVPLKFPREGIKYAELSEEEKDEWDALEWGTDDPPDEVDAAMLNRWLFNKDTVDKVLAKLMTDGLTVAGGDRVGKTIIFAKNQDHADFIVDRFDANYPHLKGEFCRSVTYRTEYAQTLIDGFSASEKVPHIAVSVDMLDTGIDVPEVVNLVFFKRVRSKTKFWQMVGRGTRLRPDLFGPGMDKTNFFIFDYCENLEFFGTEPDLADKAPGESLASRLFKSRLELTAALDKETGGSGLAPTDPESEVENDEDLRRTTVGLLHREVAAMNIDNFVVRPARRTVERFAKPEAWTKLTASEIADLAHEVAGLPSELESELEEAKRFDLLLLTLQLSVLRAEPGFERLRDKVKDIAGRLEEKASIPAVAKEMELIEELGTDEWWIDVTLPMLERVRRRLRGLVHLIEKEGRATLYTDFEDEIGVDVAVDLPGVGGGGEGDLERFRAKAKAYLHGHLDHITIQKLRLNKQLTPKDVEELAAMLHEVGDDTDVSRAASEAEGLGLFVRSLVGLDQAAAKAALGELLSGSNATANQIDFLNMIVDHLTHHGVMDAGVLYESPFTDLASQGPEGLFPPEKIEQLLTALAEVRARAVAA